MISRGVKACAQQVLCALVGLAGLVIMFQYLFRPSHPSAEALEGEVVELKRQVETLRRSRESVEHYNVHDEPTRLLGTTPLTQAEKVVDEHLRTICLVIIAIAVVFAALYYLRSIFVPLFLAIALAQLLLPMIDWLTLPRRLFCLRYRLPRNVAVIIAVMTAAIVVFNIGLLMAESVAVFAQNADRYNTRVVQIVDLGFDMAERTRLQLEYQTAAARAGVVDTYEAAASAAYALGDGLSWYEALDIINGTEGNGTRLLELQYAEYFGNSTLANGTSSHDKEIYQAFADALTAINLSELIRSLLGSAATVIEDLVYVLLFLMFMLLGSASPAGQSTPGHEWSPGEARGGDPCMGVPLGSPGLRRDSSVESIVQMHDAAREQVTKYIQGKLLIALVVASAHAAVLWKVGLDLFFVFGLLSFALNFVPAIGMFISICLPMPLVALDDAFSPGEALLALPMHMHMHMPPCACPHAHAHAHFTCTCTCTTPSRQARRCSRWRCRWRWAPLQRT